MSVIGHKSSWFSVVPKVWTDGRQVHAQTSLLLRILSLWSYDRVLHVDPDTRYLTLETKSFWFFRKRRIIPFARIDYVTYGFSSMGTSWGGWWMSFRRQDSVESYTVGLRMKDTEELPLFSFRGEGANMTGIGGVLMGDSLVDFEGEQEDASRAFLDLMKRTLGLGLGAPLPALRDAQGGQWACVSCARAGPPRAAPCLYCGGDVKQVQTTGYR